MSDMFTDIVNANRAAKAKRDEMIDRYNAKHFPPVCHIPQGGYAPQYITEEKLAETEKYWANIRTNRRALLKRHNRNLFIKASGLRGYWGDHQYAAAMQLVANIDAPYGTEAWYGKMWDAKPNRYANLTPETRSLIKAVIDIEARGQISYAERKELDKHVAAITTDMHEGMTTHREIRVNTRGAYGKRGIKGTMSKVTRNDNYIPTALIKQLNTVGHATHPMLNREESAWLTIQIRMQPAACTVRVIPNGTYAWCNTKSESENGRGYIKPVSDYGMFTVKKNADDKKVRDSRTVKAPVIPDVVKYQHIIGVIGNVE